MVAVEESLGLFPGAGTGFTEFVDGIILHEDILSAQLS